VNSIFSTVQFHCTCAKNINCSEILNIILTPDTVANVLMYRLHCFGEFWHVGEQVWYIMVWFNVPLDILVHFGDSGVTSASARIVAAVSAEASSTVQPHSEAGVEQCCVVTRVVSSEISLGKFPEIYSNLSGNFQKFLK